MHNRSKLLLIGSLLAFSLAACDRPSEPRTAGDNKGVVDRTQAVASDATITAKVKSKFVADDQLKAHEINVDTKNGVVTLSGSVSDPGSKERAATVAREVEGVTSVDNKLTVRSS